MRKIKLKRIRLLFATSIGILLLVVIGIAVHVQTGTFIHENTRYWSTPKEIKAFSSSRKGYEFAAEMLIEEKDFFDISSKNSWNMKPIQDKPFKIIRYTFAKIDTLLCRKQILYGTIDEESNDSSYHYITDGYYCIHETADKGFYHIGYDKKQGVLYEYHWFRGMGPYKELDMNPNFFDSCVCPENLK
jgi:hypothetical protein